MYTVCVVVVAGTDVSPPEAYDNLVEVSSDGLNTAKSDNSEKPPIDASVTDKTACGQRQGENTEVTSKYV